MNNSNNLAFAEDFSSNNTNSYSNNYNNSSTTIIDLVQNNENKSTIDRLSELNSIKIFAFDKDNTITPANGPIEDSIATKIINLTKNRLVIILTARDINTCKEHIISGIKKNISNEKNFDPEKLILCCSNGSQIYEYNKKHNNYIIMSQLSGDLVGMDIFNKAKSIIAKELGVNDDDLYFEIRSDTMATFACIPIDSPREEKLNFDPDLKKRKEIIKKIQSLFPDGYEIIPGGSTSIDIGLYNKKSGMEHLINFLKNKHNIDHKEYGLAYFGDNFDGGNDTPVEEVDGITIIKVKNQGQTNDILKKILS